MLENHDHTILINSVYDPTRTTTLRNQFVRALQKRFIALCQAIYQKVVTEDCFGSKLQAPVINADSRAVFAFPRSAEKVDAFMQWLRTQVDEGILTVKEYNQLGSAIESAWTNMYITDSYKRGVIRARYELQKAGYNVPSMEATGGIGMSMFIPLHMDRVGLLYTRTYSDLKGITTAMDTQISRILAQGMADGDGPILLAKKMVSAINGSGMGDLGITDTVGRFIPAMRRAEILARTEIIRAHHQGMIQEYRNWALEGVVVQAEVVTAGDDRVCGICDAVAANSPYTLDDAENLIPVHPQCLIDPQTPIYTSNGWKQIGSIEIGDLVLTHKKRFRKVYALPKSRGEKGTDVVTFYFRGDKKVSVTANHLVLVSKPGITTARWKEAGKCTENDFIMMLSNKCEQCGKLIPYYGKFCDTSCWSRNTVQKQWANPEHRKIVSRKNRIAILKQYESGERDASIITKKANKQIRINIENGTHPFQRPEVKASNKLKNNLPRHRKAQSKRMKSNNPMLDPVTVEKAKNSMRLLWINNPEKRLNARLARNRWDGKMTWIEQRMSELLDKIGIEYISQYPILRYNVDFAIPSLKIVIECDGEHWHKDKEKDGVRQANIEKEGWFVLRYTGARINQCIDEIGSELIRVVSNHTGEYLTGAQQIQSIKKWQFKKTHQLFNLSVEEDESYIAKGIVVHNCRCIALPFEVGVDELIKK